MYVVAVAGGMEKKKIIKPIYTAYEQKDVDGSALAGTKNGRATTPTTVTAALRDRRQRGDRPTVMRRVGENWFCRRHAL